MQRGGGLRYIRAVRELGFDMRGGGGSIRGACRGAAEGVDVGGELARAGLTECVSELTAYKNRTDGMRERAHGLQKQDRRNA